MSTDERPPPKQAIDVTCPLCGYGPGEACRQPSGGLAPFTHRARVVLSVVGDKSAAAVARIDEILRLAKARGGTNRSTFTRIP